MFERLFSALRFDLDSDYQEFYDDIDWRTFRTDNRVYGKWFRPSMDYVRSLQYAFESMIDDVQDNSVIDQTKLLEKYNELVYKVSELKMELAENNGEILVLQKQLSDARAYQTQSGRKQELGITPQESCPGREDNGQFISSDGITTKQKQMCLYVAKREGMDVESIAEKLHVKSQSVPVYISNGKSHAHEILLVDGNIMLSWDDGYKQYTDTIKPILNALKTA